MDDLDTAFWLGLILSIPFSIISNVIYAGIQKLLARRSLQAHSTALEGARRTWIVRVVDRLVRLWEARSDYLTELTTEQQMAVALRKNSVLYQTYLHRTLVRMLVLALCALLSGVIPAAFANFVATILSLIGMWNPMQGPPPAFVPVNNAIVIVGCVSLTVSLLWLTNTFRKHRRILRLIDGRPA